MNGTTPGLDMSMVEAFCKIVPDADGQITEWICQGLNEQPESFGSHLTVGIAYAGKLIAGIIFSSIEPNLNVWLSIYSIDKRWCCRRILRFVFDMAFIRMNVSRITVCIDVENVKSQKLVEKIGFRQEGRLRRFISPDRDCFIYGLLKSERKY